MKNQELFHKTVGILVAAYQNHTLQHGLCDACAVGNLVRANLVSPGEMSLGRQLGWPAVFATIISRRGDIEQYIRPDFLSKPNAREQIKSTGYNYKNLAKIEYAFETADKGNSKEDRMFNGLMAVVDVLMRIHEANTEETLQAKQLFVKA